MSHIRKTPNGRFEVRYRALIESTLEAWAKPGPSSAASPSQPEELEKLEPDAIPWRGTRRHSGEPHGTGRHVNRRRRAVRAGPWQPGRPDDKWEARS